MKISFLYQQNCKCTSTAFIRNILDLNDDVWHTLTHTCTSRLAQDGIGLAEVKFWLGYETIATTQKYADLNPVMLQGICNSMSARVDAIGGANVTQ
ncbi:MAG: hypothetical protein P8L82_01290 [Paracoccaceae bacterium]|nr:hypothetical protein [Paracoccaceae bacterium]